MDLDSQENRAYAKQLLSGCPFLIELPECPLKELRTLDFAERIAKINSMSDTEIDSVIRYHEECSARRQGFEKIEKGR